MDMSTQSARADKSSDRIDPTAWYLVLFLLVMSPAIAQLWVSKSAAAAVAIFIEFFVVISLHYAFAWRRGLVALLSPIVLITVFDTLYFLEYGEPLSLRTFAIVFQTPIHETQAYVMARGFQFLLAIGVCLFVCFKIWRAPEPTRRQSGSNNWLTRVSVMVAFVCFGLALLGFFGVSQIRSLGTISIVEFFGRGVASSYPYKPVMRSLQYLEMDSKFQLFQAEKFATDLSKIVRLKSGFSSQEKNVGVILILGESSNKSRWSLYGYERSTTPNLLARSGLIRLDDVVSPWPSTMASVPVIMTKKAATDSALYTSESGLSRILQTAGYETHWVSNQGHNGNFDRSIKQLYSESQFQTFLSGATALAIGQHSDDLKLLPFVKTALQSKSEKVFLVIHTQGSHYPFWERYPASGERFTPAKRGEDFFNDRSGNRDWQSVSNSYDNSILHTDLVLDQIIQAAVASGRDARLVYVSDHGASIPNASCDELGQGYANEAVLRVPGFVWHSGHFELANPSMYQALLSNSKLAISTTSIFPTVLALAGVQLAGVAENLSLTSSQFLKSPQIVNTGQGVVSISNLIGDKSCQ
jgi:glucan phosphoethanolaminetransferase (alkaline phosphatase superfamily)